MRHVHQVAEVAPGHLAHVLELRRAHQYELGFIPRTRLESLAGRGLVHQVSEGGLEAGFAVHEPLSRRPRVWKIQQACVELDLRRSSHGLALVEHVCAIARLDGREVVECRCRADNTALLFWAAAGFGAVAVVEGGRRYGIPVVVLRRALVPGVDLRAEAPCGPRSKKRWTWLASPTEGGVSIPA